MTHGISQASRDYLNLDFPSRVYDPRIDIKWSHNDQHVLENVHTNLLPQLIAHYMYFMTYKLVAFMIRTVKDVTHNFTIAWFLSMAPLLSYSPSSRE